MLDGSRGLPSGVEDHGAKSCPAQQSAILVPMLLY